MGEPLFAETIGAERLRLEAASKTTWQNSGSEEFKAVELVQD
jgi:hypothetical protein